MRAAWGLSAALALSGCAHTPRRAAAPLFESASASAGLPADPTSAWAAAWIDVDADGDLDLYNNHHASPPVLYLNQGDGRLVAAPSWLDLAKGLACDCHGVAFVDFDNDGLPDLFESSGRSATQDAPHRLWNNLGDAFLDVATPMNLAQPGARGRLSMWADLNRDGLLDVLEVNEPAPNNEWPTALYIRAPGGFQHVPDAMFSPPESTKLATLVDLGDQPGVLIATGGTLHLYRWTPQGLVQDAATPVRYFEAVRGLIAEDLDGDGAQDLLVLNGFGNLQSGFHQPTPRELVAALATHGEPQGVDFELAGPLQVTVTWSVLDKHVAVVVAGADAPLPIADSYTIDPQQVLEGAPFPNVTDPRVKVVLGVSRSGDRWSLQNLKMGSYGVAVDVRSDHPIRRPALTGRNAWGGVTRFFAGGSEVDTAAMVGLDLSPFCGNSAVVGDFDNDMDLDVFAVCSEPTRKVANLLLRNDGRGGFRPVRGHGADDDAAIGAMGVITADYDGDGSLDLLVLAGQWTPPATTAPLQLYRGLPSDNHWLEVDLQGSRSNRMGIGAEVVVEASGRAQTRWETGGLQGPSQSGPRLHVGLGPNPIADKITVHWPSGVVQVLESVTADQVLRIVEP